MDKKYYEKAAMEVAAGQLDQALMIKAIAHAGGDDAKAKAMYLYLRAEELQGEARMLLLGGAKARAIDVAESARSGIKTAIEVTAKVVGVLVGFVLLVSLVSLLTSTANLGGSEHVETHANPDGEIEGARDAPVSADADEQRDQFKLMALVLIQQDPRLNRQSADFDSNVASTLNARINLYESMGVTPPRAIQAAARDVLGLDLTIPPATDYREVARRSVDSE